MRKVELKVIRPWVAKKVVDLVGFEDEVVIEYAMGLLEDESQPVRPVIVVCRVALTALLSRRPTRRRCRSTSPGS
jgi:serine/arginine repetitive matrix protein 1